MVDMEYNPLFFSEIMPYEQLISLPVPTRDMLSRKALQRLMDAICDRTPK